MSFETVLHARGAVAVALARVGTTQLTDEEFTWWFDCNPEARESCRSPSTTEVGPLR